MQRSAFVSITKRLLKLNQANDLL